MRGSSRLGTLLLGFALLLGAASSAHAAGASCSDYTNIGTVADPHYVVDGSIPSVYNAVASNSTFAIDETCTIKNFPAPSEFPITNINYYLNDKTKRYLIVFDNVAYSGNMACASLTDYMAIWWVNGSYHNIPTQCQDFLLPVDAIQKSNPVGQTTAAVGVPFTYKLTMPVMMMLTDTGYVYENPITDGQPLTDVHIYDDLTTTGADLTYVDNTASMTCPIIGNVPIPGGKLTNLGDSKHLHFYMNLIPAGCQVTVNVQVVPDTTNVAGTQFTNTATWTFDKTVNGVFRDNLVGQNGITDPMTILAPNLVVTKSGTTTVINQGQYGYFDIYAKNEGLYVSDAWNVSIFDQLPNSVDAGMCAMTPDILSPGLGVEIIGATTRTLTASQYTFNYTGESVPAAPDDCQLTITLNDSAGPIKPGEQLHVRYRTKLDPGTVSGDLYNIAAAQQWFSDKSTNTRRSTFTCIPTPYTGTPGVADCQDNHMVSVVLAGYFYEKTVENLATNTYPAKVAAAGDTLRYTLRLTNVDQVFGTLRFYDDLGAGDPTLTMFEPGSLRNITINGTTGTNNSDPAAGTNGAGILDISGLTIATPAVGGDPTEITVTFDITLASSLANGDIALNQAKLFEGASITPKTISDDPYDWDGRSDPAVSGDEYPTEVMIQTPQPPLKTINPLITQATIGDEVVYQITVPAYGEALYNVVVNDTLDPALEFVSATNDTTGATLTDDPTKSGVNLSIGTISPNQTVVITLRARVVNHTGVGIAATDTYKSFTNTASYSYTRTVSSTTVVDSGPSAVTPLINIVEPVLTVGKTVSNVTTPGAPAAAGDTLQYTVAISNGGTSTAFDINIADVLPANVTLDETSVIASGTVDVSGFNPIPTKPAGTNTKIWGRGNGDSTLDIPVGGQLVLTYQVTVVTNNGMPISNSVNVDWTSLQDTPPGERTGASCPAAPNDYCFGPIAATIPVVDPTTIVKTVVSDTWDSGLSNDTDAILRIGDTVVYRHTLTLREGLTESVKVTDTLPAGLAYDGLVSITPSGGNFTYSVISQPSVGATGALLWDLGNISNTNDYSVGNDTFVIEYRARVVTDNTIIQVGSTPLVNNVVLSYTGGDPLVNANLNSTATVDVRQPVITVAKSGTVTTLAGVTVSPITGDGLTSGTAYVVDIVNHKMSFNLQTCNATDPAAPAYGVVITDTLDPELDQASITTPVVSISGVGTLTAGTHYTYVAPTARGGTMSFTLHDNTPLNPGACVTVSYNIGFYTDIAPNSYWHNSGDVTSYWSLAPGSGREYTVTAESMVWMTNTFVPVPPTKTVVTPAGGQLTIGETVTYEITVPSTQVNAALRNVVITDTLDSRLQYQSFTQVSGPAATKDPGSLSFTVPVIKAGEQVKIQVTALVLNTTANAGDTIPNYVSYLYDGQATPIQSTIPANVTIIEPLVTMSKAVSNITTPGAQASGGDTLEYTLTLTNSGTSIARDVNITDALPPEVTLVPGSATAVMSGTGAVAGFNPTPATTGINTKIWGSGNGDNSLDIPASGGVLTLTFRVTVQEISSSSLVNNATADWTSLDGASTAERTGAGCAPGVTLPLPAPNDYCTSASVSIAPLDTNAIAKALTNDTWNTDGSTNIDMISRVGDTITYQLTLTLREGLTRNVTIQDALDPGLAFVDVVSVNGDTTTPYSSTTGVFSYSATSVPVAGQTGTLLWSLGNITNTVDGNPANNNFVIVYRARVQHGAAEAPAPTPTTTALANTATLGYSYSDGSAVPLDATRMQSSASLTVHQPLISAITKSGAVFTTAGAPVTTTGDGTTEATAYVVDIVNHKMRFNLQACNSGQAPAYGVVITDTLQPELNQASITTPLVTITAGATTTTLNAGTDYSYVPPATRGGQMSFTLNTPLDPTECVNVEYFVGFYTDIPPDQTWSNQAAVGQYWSLPPNGAREYIAITPVTPALVWMTNRFVPVQPSKTVFAPGSGEVTIGETVTYEITVPATPVNAALANVSITDTLDARLQYQSFTQSSGPAVTNTTTPAGSNNLSFTIAQLPAGQVAKFQVTALVLNSAATQAESGGAIQNSVTYTYDNAVSPLTNPTPATVTIVEPLITVNKTAPVTQPKVGDILNYEVELAASGNVPGDIYSNAYDVSVVDTLGLGLKYVTGSAKLDGVVAIGDPTTNGADGISAQQILTWAGLDVTEGTAPKLTYEVQVLSNVGASQTLRNDVRVEWTGIDGANANERNGTATPAHNDYFSTDFTVVTTLPPAVLSKLNPTDTNVAIGQTFTYTIRVPETAAVTAVHDVRITDYLPAGVTFVSVAKGSAWGTWTPVGSVTGSTLTITDTGGQGIDIPVGAQAEVTVTVMLNNDIVTNYSGRTFTNTANYTFNRVNDDTSTVTTTANVTTGAMTVIGPDRLTMDKNGPSGMRLGVPGTFTLTVVNNGTGRAWDVTVTDYLPNPAPGGMCSIPPAITSVQIVGPSGTRTLTAGADYVTDFGYPASSPANTCTFTFTGQSAAAALDPTEQLIITYNAELDPDNGNNVPLINYAGATQWFSQDTNGTPTGQTHTYSCALTNGTTADPTDCQDAHTVHTESPTLQVEKAVFHADGTAAPTAQPGETLRYTVTIRNASEVTLPNFSLVDDLGILNVGKGVFVSGTLTGVSVTGDAIYTNASDANGGTDNAGRVEISGLTLGKQSETNNTITVTFNITLAGVIPNNTVVLNQAEILSYGYTLDTSDGPGYTGPTRTVIASNPVMDVRKTAQDITGDANVLMVGDTLRYTITVRNIGNENAIDVMLRDALPANTAYVSGSTRLNGAVYPDSGTLPLDTATGILINAPENTTPGAMRADANPLVTSNVATITFDVTVNMDTPDGTVISNQGIVTGNGAGGTAFTDTLSDDPGVGGLTDPTNKTVVKPNGIVYNSISREPVAGVTLTLFNTTLGVAVPSACFSDPSQQGQVTTASGYYKFDLNFNYPECQPYHNYLIQVAAVPADLSAGTSVLIPPTSTAAFDVSACNGDAVPATTHCEAQATAAAPLEGAPTTYYLHLNLGNNVVPDDSQIFNNHIPVDPKFEQALRIMKRTHLVNVTRGQLVPYTITVENTLRGTLYDMVITDTFPAGFKYVEGSARYTIEGSPTVNNVAREPLRNGRELRWEGITLAPNDKHTIKLLLVVGSGVSEGEYINQAQTWSVLTPDNTSRVATASVRVVPDPTFDCTDIIGKVFDDANRNGYQDKGEKGLPGVRMVTARGLLVKSDEHGRYHITCAAVPDENRGSNFIIKVDERTLPTGYRITTENPLVLRATRGKMMKFNFGATIHKVVRIDISNGVYEPGTNNLRIQWKPRMDLLMGELKKGPSVLRIGYMAEVEDEDLVEERLKVLKQEIAQRWTQQNGGYELEIETEVFWRTGAPPDRSMVK